MEIQYYNRKNNCLETEKIYGDKVIKWLYQTKPGNSLSLLLCKKFISKIYGAFQNSKKSAKKIVPFIKEFDIKINDFGIESTDPKRPYSSFNNFFIRKYKKDKINFNCQTNVMPAFCEARYLGFNKITIEQTFPVKGTYLTASKILSKQKWEKTFANGPILIARLCPVDYHRFHFFDDGKILDFYQIKGNYQSVNPIALKVMPDIYATNHRNVTILETKNFGKIAYVEVGAMCVGKIVQTFKNEHFVRGQEKGYFLFGASTVIVMGEKEKWIPSDDILSYSKKQIETYITLGDAVGNKI